MEVVVNGQPRRIEVRTVRELVKAEFASDHDGRGIAVAVNGRVVPRTRWDEAAIGSGDRVEIVRALPGG